MTRPADGTRNLPPDRPEALGHTDRKGRPLIFQHGLCGDAAQPADVFPEQAGWQAVTLECRGHGQSEAGPADAFAIATFADDLVDLIESEGLAPLPLAGISMGAAICLRIAATRPELVSALVLARSAWLDRPSPANMMPNHVVGSCATIPRPTLGLHSTPCRWRRTW